MKLKNFIELIKTYHFAIRVRYEHDIKECMYSTNEAYDLNVDELEVIGVDVTTEIEKESPITHTISIRPILLVVLKGE